MSRVDPLEVRLPPVDLHFQKTFRLSLNRFLSHAANRPIELRRIRRLQEDVDVLQVLAEQVIEQPVLCGRMIVAEPPEPVAPFGDVDFVPRAGEELGGQRVRRFGLIELRLFEELARLVEQIPRGVILGVTDPDAEVVVDPTPREQVRNVIGRRELADVILDSDRLHVRARDATAVERSQELNASIREVLPAVLAVQDDRDECRSSRVVWCRREANRVDLAQQIVGRMLRVGPLILKANQVAERMIAEDDLHRTALFFESPGSIEHLGIAQVSAAIARDPAVRGRGKNLFIRGDPFDPLIGDGRDHFLRDRSLGRPHPDGVRSEQLAMELDPFLELRDGVLAVRVQKLGQHATGHRLPRTALVPQERQDRVIERRGRQFDLAALHQFPMERNDLSQHIELLVEQPRFLSLRPAVSLQQERLQVGVEIKQQRMEPCEVAPDLQVSDVTFCEPLDRLLERIAVGRPLLVQLRVTRMRADHVVVVGHEELVEQEARVGFVQTIGGSPRDIEMPVARTAVGVRQQLFEQAGNKIDRATKLGHLFDVPRHPPIVLRPMQPHPRHRVLTPDAIRVVGLMLMPDKGEVDGRHEGRGLSRRISSKSGFS